MKDFLEVVGGMLCFLKMINEVVLFLDFLLEFELVFFEFEVFFPHEIEFIFHVEKAVFELRTLFPQENVFLFYLADFEVFSAHLFEIFQLVYLLEQFPLVVNELVVLEFLRLEFC